MPHVPHLSSPGDPQPVRQTPPDGVVREPQSPVDSSVAPAKSETLGTSANGTAPDPFDPVALRLSQDFTAGLGVKKALLTVPVRKPDKSWFVRVHPSEDYALP